MKKKDVRRTEPGVGRAIGTSLLVAVVLFGAACGSDSSGSANGNMPGPVEESFEPTLSGSASLGGLSDGELATLCGEIGNFFEASGVNEGLCVVTAIGASSLASLSETATDADLQAACSEAYAECTNAGTTAPMCAAPADNCTATVAEYATCLEDMAAEVRLVSGQLPECGAITRSTFEDNGQLPPLQGPSSPASCDLVERKCSGLSEEASAFVEQYCGLVAPCCAEAGLGAQCASNVRDAAQAGTFNPAAGAQCLAALAERVGGAGCDALGGDLEPSWAVIAECRRVFAGGIAAGQPCQTDSECAPPPGGDALCFGIAEPPVCIAISGREGDGPCSGTFRRDATGATFDNISDAPPLEYLCDLDQGLVCDPATQRCAASRGVGEACGDALQCGGALYCDFSAGVCAARLAIGAPCANTFGECESAGFCSSAGTCAVPVGGGASCSGEDYSECRGGFCEDGVCSEPLLLLCGG